MQRLPGSIDRQVATPLTPLTLVRPHADSNTTSSLTPLYFYLFLYQTGSLQQTVIDGLYHLEPGALAPGCGARLANVAL